MLHGIDVSGWQAGINLAAVPSDFVIIKATGGVTYVSTDCDRQYHQAKAAGKLVGVYHFANDDHNGSSAVAEEDFFVNNTLGYHDGETILVLDFEMQALPLGPGWALAFLQRVQERTGIKPVIYLQGSEASQSKYDPLVQNDFGLWLAHWTMNHSVSGHQTPPAPMATRWPFAILHQYSSQGRLPGWGGDLDMNTFDGDRSTWMAYAAKNGSVKPTPPTPKPNPESKTIDQLAAEVRAGAWGDGQDRVDRLTAAGYDAVAVQARVNEQIAAAGGNPPTGGASYTVRSGDTLSGIGQAFGVSWRDIAAANGIANPNVIHPGQVLSIPGASATGGSTYEVRRGDTLSGIADRFGTTYQNLAALNGIPNPNIIQVGQIIRLP